MSETIVYLGVPLQKLHLVSKAPQSERWLCLLPDGSELVLDILSDRSLSRATLRFRVDSPTASLRQQFSHEFKVWKGIINRCNTDADGYGARGISVSEDWTSSFQNFVDDMGRCPDGFTIDRIDVNGNYERGNCRWASRFTQDRNKRSNLFVFFQGERMIAADAARTAGVKPSRLLQLLRSGISADSAAATLAAQGVYSGCC